MGACLCGRPHAHLPPRPFLKELMKDPINALYASMYGENLKHIEKHKNPAMRFRASESATCWKQIYLRHTGYMPIPVLPDIEMLGVQGSVDHDVTRQLLAQHGVVLKETTTDADGNTDETLEGFCEVDVKGTKIIVSFRADGEVSTPQGDGLLEIKGMGFYPYDYMQKAFIAGGNEGCVERLKTKHVRYYWQMMMSVYLSNTFRGKDYKFAYFLPKDRSGGNLGVGEFTRTRDPLTGEYTFRNTRTGIYVPFDQATVDHVLAKFAHVSRSVEAYTAPSPQYAAGSDSCEKYCPFVYACHHADERAAKGIEPAVLYPKETRIETLDG